MPNVAQKVIATLGNICDYIRFLDKGPKYRLVAGLHNAEDA